ncbi:MAG: ABC transporter permease [Bacilli bacterium]|nr:ABC transporter permease [Bacilli bacterium]
MSQKRSFPLYVTKRIGLAKWKYWLIRVGGILLAFLIAGIVCTMLKPGSFLTFYSEMFRGCFDFSDITTVIDLLVTFSILLLIALTLTPAFKMKFWNIGAEGQILIGALAAAGVAKFAPSEWPNILILVFALFAAQVASAIWCLIPGLFRAYFHTNETLFTLMMNYIAAVLASMMISVWIPNGSQKFGTLTQGIFPTILGHSGTLVIIFTLVIFVGMYFYINHGKSGFEVAVIGESVDTARYAGINVSHVTLRVMTVSGLLFGAIGFFIVCGIHQSFSPTIVAGKGFTGVLIAWLGHFNPFEIALFAFLSAVMECGTTTAATAVNISASRFTAICTGAFFFIIIACEFFSRYQVHIRVKEKGEVEEA